MKNDVVLSVRKPGYSHYFFCPCLCRKLSAIRISDIYYLPYGLIWKKKKKASPALGLKSLWNHRNKLSLAEIWAALFLRNEVVIKTSQGKCFTYFASTMIQLGPRDLAPVVWLGFDSHHLYKTHLSLSVCAPRVDSNRISLPSYLTLLQLSDAEHLITKHLFSLASLRHVNPKTRIA